MLLLLATGLLMVSSSYRGTVLRNHADVAHSRVGANWRVAIDPSSQSLALAARLPVDAMGVYRSQADLVTGVASQATALAIDPARFTAAAWWRSDYAGRPLSDLLGDLRVPSSSPSLPAGTNGIDVTVDAPTPAGGLDLRAVVGTAGERTSTIDLGVVRSGLATYHADAPGATRLLSLDLVRPSLFFHAPKHFKVRFVKASAAGTGGAYDIPLESWDVLRWRSADGSAVPDANGGLDATFDAGFGDVAAGVAAPLPTLPAFASPDVVQVAGHHFDTVIGGAVFTVRVVDVPAGFPGTSAGESFFVVPEQVVFQGLERIPEASDGLNEVWSMSRTTPVPALRRLGLIANEVTSAATVEAGLSEDPQSLAVGMHYTAAAAGMVLVVVGVAVGAYFAQRRRLFEFAALRAMGAERGQILGAMFGEEGVVIAFALLTALGIGFVLLRLMMPYLAATVSTAFPPPLLFLDWRALAAFAAAVVATAGLGLALAARALLAAPVTTVLRGEAE